MDFGISKRTDVTWVEHLMILVLLATSGFPAFMSYRFVNIIFLPYILNKINRQKGINRNHIRLIILILLIYLFVQVLYAHVSIGGLTESILFYSTVLFEAAYIGAKFRNIYCHQILFFSIISLAFFIPIFISPSFHDNILALKSIIPQIGENFNNISSNPGTNLYVVFISDAVSYVNGLYRNCGPFYEPGLFASFVSIALIINLANEKKIFNFANIVYVLTILSTISTGGYMVLMLIVIYYVFSQDSKIYRIGLIAVLPILLPYIYDLDFVGSKMEENLASSSYKAYSRFGAMAYHWEKIKESPLIGYHGGAMPNTALDSVMSSFEGRMISPNGITWVFVYYGIPLAIIFYIYLYKSIDYLLPIYRRKWETAVIFLIFLLCAFSQTITTMPIFYLILSLAITHYKKNNTIKNYENRNNSYISISARNGSNC